MDGMVPGNKTLRKISFSFACSVRAASIRIGLMDKTPEIVFKRIGKKAPKKMIKAADFMPIPNQRIAMGIQASGGMGLTTSTTGRIIFRSFGDHPMRSPKGIANRDAAAYPRTTR
jgi:hypothetical protein